MIGQKRSADREDPLAHQGHMAKKQKSSSAGKKDDLERKIARLGPLQPAITQ